MSVTIEVLYWTMSPYLVAYWSPYLVAYWTMPSKLKIYCIISWYLKVLLTIP
jgi:hypothetical protein